MNARLKEVLYWLVLIAPLGLMLSLMPNIPSVIPLHYNFSGEVTRYGSKYEMLILPVIGIAIAVTLNLLSRSLAKKSERGLQNGKILVQIVCCIGKGGENNHFTVIIINRVFNLLSDMLG